MSVSMQYCRGCDVLWKHGDCWVCGRPSDEKRTIFLALSSRMVPPQALDQNG